MTAVVDDKHIVCSLYLDVLLKDGFDKCQIQNNYYFILKNTACFTSL